MEESDIHGCWCFLCSVPVPIEDVVLEAALRYCKECLIQCHWCAKNCVAERLKSGSPRNGGDAIAQESSPVQIPSATST